MPIIEKVKLPEIPNNQRVKIARYNSTHVTWENVRSSSEQGRFVLAWDGDLDDMTNPITFGIIEGAEYQDGKCRYIVDTDCFSGLRYEHAAVIDSCILPSVITKDGCDFPTGKLVGIDIEAKRAFVEESGERLYSYPIDSVAYCDDVKFGILLEDK